MRHVWEVRWYETVGGPIIQVQQSASGKVNVWVCNMWIVLYRIVYLFNDVTSVDGLVVGRLTITVVPSSISITYVDVVRVEEMNFEYRLVLLIAIFSEHKIGSCLYLVYVRCILLTDECYALWSYFSISLIIAVIVVCTVRQC